MIKQSYDYTVDTSMLDARSIITLEGYQRIVITTTEKELERLNMSIETLIKEMGVSWILLSLSVKVLKQIKPNQKLSVTTWHTWQKGVIYRRDFEISDKSSGEIYAYACTFSSLFDIQKRRLCMDRAVYQKLTLKEGEESFEAQSRYNPTGDFTYCEETVVRPHWIDCLGHVNNFKYGQLTFDNLTENDRENSHEINKIEMFFTGELRLGESVKISRRKEEKVVEIMGEHSENGRSAFLTRIHY